MTPIGQKIVRVAFSKAQGQLCEQFSYPPYSVTEHPGMFHNDGIIISMLSTSYFVVRHSCLVPNEGHPWCSSERVRYS